MRVCHLCSAHHVDDGRVFKRACVSLAAEGYEVHLLASGEQRETFVDQGVIVHPLSQSSGTRDRLKRRMHVAGAAAALKPDLFHVHEPELLGPTLALAGSRPVIWDVHESYMDVLMTREWIPRGVRWCARMAWDKVERRLVRRCAAVIAATDGVADRYYPMHSAVEIVANYPDLSEWHVTAPENRSGGGCVFTGTLSPNRGVFQVIQSLGILEKRGLRIPLVIAGAAHDGRGRGTSPYLQSLFDEAKRLGVGDLVTYHGVLSRRDVVPIVADATIGVVPHLPFGNNLAAWPVKMFEYMAVGLPIVYSDLPSHHAIAGESGAGIAVDPREPTHIADAIERLVRDPDLAEQLGEAGKQAVRERFNWDVESIKLLELYSEILGTRPRQ